MIHATTSTPSEGTLDYLTHADNSARTETGCKRSADDMAKDMVLDDDNMQFCGSGDWVRYRTTNPFRGTQLDGMKLVMKFDRNNPLVLTNAHLNILRGDNSKYTMYFNMMCEGRGLPDEMQRVRDEVVQHVKSHDHGADMTCITAENVSDNLVIEMWGNHVSQIKGETGSKLRMVDGMPAGIDTTAISQYGVNVDNFECLKNVPVTGYVRFEGYYYSRVDPNKVRISWGFHMDNKREKGQENVYAKVYTDISVQRADDETSDNYSALMNDF